MSKADLLGLAGGVQYPNNAIYRRLKLTRTSLLTKVESPIMKARLEALVKSVASTLDSLREMDLIYWARTRIACWKKRDRLYAIG